MNYEQATGKCPVCKKVKLFEGELEGRNAVSRIDNDTYICSDCGEREGLADFYNHYKFNMTAEEKLAEEL